MTEQDTRTPATVIAGWFYEHGFGGVDTDELQSLSSALAEAGYTICSPGSVVVERDRVLITCTGCGQTYGYAIATIAQGVTDDAQERAREAIAEEVRRWTTVEGHQYTAARKVVYCLTEANLTLIDTTELERLRELAALMSKPATGRRVRGCDD